MPNVTSKDGTVIAYATQGSGPALILVDGAFGSRTFGPNESLAPHLADKFTVYNYDRRGRGESGDTAPFAIEREVEDLEAVIKAAGGSAFVYGISSGAALALEAANRGLAIDKLAVFEAPFVVDDTRPPIPEDCLPHLQELVAADKRGEAIKYFMTKGVALPGIFVALMRIMPAWGKLKRVAHTIPYDVAFLGDAGQGKPLPTDKWTGVTMPTLVIDGGKSPQWTRNAMPALAKVLPNAEHHRLPGQMHIVKPKAIGPVLSDFFAA
jgi:pimeloyl-ACP methyl ester carboxylesterase